VREVDKIIIYGISTWCKIGLLTTERVERQPLEIDVEIRTNTKEAGIKDDVRESVDYSVVLDKVKEVVSKEFCTIESVAENIAGEIKHYFTVRSVLVRVKKPGALARKGVKYVAVEIER
jgi:7,8-dihydroneopterin aldolase/epimerase/oxygenase